MLGRLDPATGEVEEVDLGNGSAPHGVIVGPDGAAWVTDGGRNAIQRVDHDRLEVAEFPLPSANANLNTAAFDGDGTLWFTGQSGVYGSVDGATGEVEVHDAPRGRGPYGIASTPDGTGTRRWRAATSLGSTGPTAASRSSTSRPTAAERAASGATAAATCG
ncbi:MAG: hypothetical protein KY469_06880 [Actinobacteria bacterium]|nr:hypothetical protein [Actinomycetota bacterium]